ncbi:translocation/assembly module TamB domain-containing protein [Hymenobacter sp. BT664]|uniref:Translocation/assembly module TamB domain-containing protein n=1 Tax=Hymenobacter montanus TaxID=2771359 RepID=A0A927BBU0_9BACT|nr:translocation/assembly module TamB domain-containing protein [Hymenobacter montanus]MBD2767128.1 translocation/assembly module TamB domain-containing protein [Hymenobacter montanus]
MATFLRRTLYGLLGLLALVLTLIIVVVVVLQFPAAQDFVARRAEGYLRGKLKTEVRIAKLRTDFRHVINLDGVYLADQQRDTLVSVGHLGVDIDIWALLRKQINVSSVELNDGRVRLTRTEPDSVNNYDFIIKAFTDPTAPKDTTASGLKYAIGKARLTNILFTQQDQITGSDIRAKIGEFTANMDEVDVDNSIYKVDNAALRRSAIRITQTKTAPEVDNPAPTEPLTLQFGLNRATLDSVSFTYKNAPAAQFISTTIGLADITARNIDLRNERVDLTKLTLKNTRFAYAQNEAVPVEQRVVNPAEAVRKLDDAADQAKTAKGQPLKWRVTLAQSNISGVDVAFDNFNQPRQRTRLPALDYNHLHFTDLVLNTRDFAFSENRTTAKVDNLAGREQSGFRIDSWRANVVYDSVQIRLDSLDLVTPHTRIRRTLAIGYQSLAALSDTKNLPNLKIEGDLREVRLGFRDILYLAPDLAGTSPFNTGPNQSVLVNGQIAGRVGDFTVRNLEFVGLRNTILKARRGRIQGLPNVDQRLYADLDLQQFSTSEADIRSLAPKGSIPNNISIPQSLALSGTFRGRPTTLEFTTSLNLRSSYGNLGFSGNLGAAQANGRQPVVGTFAVGGFDFGRLLKNPQLGRVTATGRINATGDVKDPATLVGQVKATVQSARYNGYTYHGVAATVDLDRNRYVIRANSKQDPNLNLDLQAVVNLRDPRQPSYQLTALNLRSANLTALGFYTGGDLRVQGNLTANLRGADANSLNGTFSGQRIVIVRDNQPFPLDSLNGRILQTAARTAVTITSTVADVNLDGNVHLGDLATELQQHIDRYFDLPGVRYVASSADRHFTYSLQLKDATLATKLVPGLKRISPFTVSGDYSRQAARLTATGSIPIIRYNNYRLDSLRVNVNSDARKLDYGLLLAQAAQDTTLKFRRPSIIGNVADNKVFTRVAILGDSANRERLALAGTLSVINGQSAGNGGRTTGPVYQFSAAPEQIINYATWTAGANNYVRYYPTGAVVADGLRLTNGRSSLALQSTNPAVPTSPLGVTFTNFELAELARIAQQRDSLVAGTLNGTARIDNLGTKRQAFTADATVSKLVFQKSLIGDLALRATNPSSNRYDLDARLTGGASASTGGAGNDVQIRGTYVTTSATPLDFVLDANRLNFKVIEPFSAGQLRSATGYIRGRLTLRGATAAPQVRGTLTTSDDAGFIVNQLGSPFRVPNQALTFDSRGIAFNNFTVLDSASNKAVANGYLLTKNFVDYAFDLRATTKDFLAVRSTRKNNPLFYGRLVLDSDTRLTGPLTLIKIDTNVTVVDGSDLTVESPSSDPSVQAREGIVKFIDKSAPLDTALARQLVLDTVRTGPQGYDITAHVKITSRTPFTFIIDPVSGDNLRVRANGDLTTNIDPSGNITLSGALTVARGSYRVSLYGLTSREFSIRRGSSLTWSGDPYNADLNLTAVYKLKASPTELIANQGSNEAQSLARNPLPFNVLINVTGNLTKPTIGFDITMPEEQRGALGGQVDARLSQLRQPDQTSEQSKQVFSLLILGRFIQQNPFESSSGESFAASQLRGSVSSVLTDQLNNLTGKYLAGLGLDLGVTNQAVYGADGNTGSRTDLNVAMRRQLFNNRLTVRVGTDIGLSGANNASTGARGGGGASNLAGDVSLEYTLLRDGRLRLRAFRQNAYEDIDGPIVRTGAALIYQREYNSLAELFEKVSPEVKQQRKRSRQEEKQDRQDQKEEDQAARDSASAVLPLRRDTLSSQATPTNTGAN